jgi:hypothetical protein
MDKEHARFVLRSYRANDGDLDDPEFADALAVAASDPEIGAWFAAERANDAAFASAIASLELPGNLRNEILDALAYQRGDLPHAESTEDRQWARALQSIKPPPGLRDSILIAMRASATPVAATGVRWKRITISAAAAAAAAITAALLVPTPHNSAQSTAGNTPVAIPAIDHGPLPVGMVRTGFVDVFQQAGFTLDTGRASHREIMRQLEERGLPCPTCIPPGLRNIEGVGCRELVINGRRGTLVCYQKDDEGLVHLVIFRAEDIRCKLPTRGRGAVFTQDGEWASAAWRNRDNAFVLIGHTNVDQLSTYF